MADSASNSNKAVAKNIGLGLVGFGTVGTGVWEILQTNGSLISERSQGKFSMEIKKAAVRDLTKTRVEGASEDLFTGDWTEVVQDPEVILW